jgi:hypothetical protein
LEDLKETDRINNWSRIAVGVMDLYNKLGPEVEYAGKLRSDNKHCTCVHVIKGCEANLRCRRK